MIGKKVRVFWPVDESWYSGTVQKFDVTTGEHLLQYPDGDTEWVKIGETTSAGGPSGGPPMDAYRDGVPPELGDRKGPQEIAHPGGPYGGFPPPAGYGAPFGGMPPHGMPPYGMFSPYGNPMFPGSSMLPGGDDKESPESDGTGRRKTGPKAWTKEEDALLLSIVKTMKMPMKWSIVAQSLPDRTGKQCRERYVNHLNPRLKVTDWNALEDSMIFHLYNTIGSHWAKMSKIIPGRTDNGIKNRFHNLRRQFEREDEHRLRLSAVNEFKDAIRLERLRAFPDKMDGKASGLWDMHSGIGILAAQSVMGGNASKNKSRFGPFRKAEPGEMCVRCGLLMPSVHTGDEVCTKSGWCQTCTRIPPHACGNLLRECLNLRREQNLELRAIIESWEEFFRKEEDPAEETAEPVAEAEAITAEE